MIIWVRIDVVHAMRTFVDLLYIDLAVCCERLVFITSLAYIALYQSLFITLTRAHTHTHTYTDIHTRAKKVEWIGLKREGYRLYPFTEF